MKNILKIRKWKVRFLIGRWIFHVNLPLTEVQKGGHLWALLMTSTDDLHVMSSWAMSQSRNLCFSHKNKQDGS